MSILKDTKSCNITHSIINNLINQIIEDISRIYHVDIESIFLPRTLTYHIYCNFMTITLNEVDLWSYSHTDILDMIIQKFNLDGDIGEFNTDNEQAIIDAGEDLLYGGLYL